MATQFKKGRRLQPLSSPSGDCSDIEPNDDKAEKLQRRQEKVMELARSSPKRLSSFTEITTHGLTNSMIVEYYTDCIKLSTENKITVKNAFGLHLIDYMAEMIKRKDSQFDNFQVASCALDASAKIYAYRVDCLHKDTLNIASSLCRRNERHETNDKNINSEPHDDDGESKKKRRVKRGRTIEGNLKNINTSKVEMQREVDPLLCQISQKFLNEGPSTAPFLTSLCHYNNDYRLIFDSTTQYPLQHQPDYCGSVQVDMAELRPFISNILKEGRRICPAFDDFNFGNRKAGDKTLPNADVHQTLDETTDDNVFESEGTPDNDSQYDGNVDDGDVMNQSRPPAESLFDKMSSDGMIMQALSTEPNEYSYFKPQFLSAWAGPSHWNIHPRQRATLVDGSKEPRAPRTKKPPSVIDFKQEIDLEGFFKKSRTSNCLSKATMRNWSDTRTTLPEDIHYEEKQFFQLFLNKAITVPQRIGLTCEQDTERSHYNYENGNDVNNFCPPTDFPNSVNSENDNVSNITESIDLPITQPENDEENPNIEGDILNLAGENLIEKPFQVPTFEIPYPRAAKKVNVKHVKLCMWRILTSNKEKTPGKKTVFSELYKALLLVVTPKTAENLSIPIAINCLLHLANEKVLEMQSNETMDELTIEMTDVEEVNRPLLNLNDEQRSKV